MVKSPDSANPYEAYMAPQNGDLPKFSDELVRMKGKILELYIGDQYETLTFEEYSQPQNCVIYGKLIEVYDRFILLDCFYVEGKTKTLKTNNRIFINAFQIRAMSELDGNGSLGDVFLSVVDAPKVRKLALAMKGK